MKTSRPPIVSSPEWRAALKAGRVNGVARSGLVERAADGSVAFVASTATADRYGDTIDQTGWDTAAFEANPVLLWAHSHSTPPVGRVVGLDKAGDLKARVEFTPREMHAFGAEVGDMVRAGFLNAVSVGFLPKSWEERFDEGGRYVGMHFKSMELLEISVVPVPANPQALLTGKSFAKSLSSWASNVDESSPMASTYAHELQALIKAADEAREKLDEAGDAEAFERIERLLMEIRDATMLSAATNAEVLKALRAGGADDNVTRAVQDDARDPLARLFASLK